MAPTATPAGGNAGVLRITLPSEPLTLVTATLDSSVKTAETGSTVTITFDSLLLFPDRDAILGTTAAPRIAEVADQIKEAGPSKLTVLAYTDTKGSLKDKQRKTQLQAKAVGKALSTAIGDDAPKVTARGRADNDLVDDLSAVKNRRVVVRFSS